jgi:hypothetical protein
VRCHGRQIRETTVNEKRGLKMSHAEPIAASANCMDCHQMAGGVIGTHNAGMNPCIRCHDAKTASSECTICHTRQGAAASSETTSMARVQVVEIKCGGCHDERRECDSCHGTRMPHSNKFKMLTHARAGAVDIWFNARSGCSKCHTATRRPCTQCHTDILGNGHPVLNAQTHQTATEATCDTCHNQWARQSQRSFCVDLCHNVDAESASPR